MNLLNIIILTCLLFLQTILPCTTAIVSGKATVDGRPLLLKNRDAGDLQNRLVYYSEGKFKFIGLVNSKDPMNSEVWCGMNESGFAIMNSASYNLKRDDTTKLSDMEGVIMKLALESCSNLEDFERLITGLQKPLGVEANFGVIDANGGAAYYETDNFSFIKFDANDPVAAPNGYLIRTNYSFSGTDNKGHGYIRYVTASNMFTDQYAKGKISFDFLISDVPRCLVHSFTGQDLENQIPSSKDDTTYVFFRDYIPRSSTASAIVVQGVKKGESPSLATMWSVLGFPLTSVIIPVWLSDEGLLPSILVADESGNAPLCNLALELKAQVFPIQNDAKENYLNLAALMNKENTGILQKIRPVEDEILARSEKLLEKWRETRKDENELKSFYDWIDSTVLAAIKSRFNGKL